MTKLILQLHISVDGFIAGADYAMDWITFNWDEKLKQYITDITAPVDHLLLGRKLADGFIPHWHARPAHEEASAIDKINGCGKTVVSRQSALQKDNSWGPNVEISTDLRPTVESLKSRQGKGDVMAYGGVEFVRSLLELGLVDEMHLLVSPIALGEGLRLFTGKQQLELVGSSGFECGIVAQHYRVRR